MITLTQLSPQQLRQAADIQEEIERLQKQLTEVLGGEVPTPVSTETPTTSGRTKGLKMSAQGLANIRAAQQARRARERGVAAIEAPAATSRKHRKLSAQGLANIRAGVAKRMARKARATTEPAGTGKPAKEPKAKKQVSELKLKALAKAREARLAKLRAAKKANRERP